MFVVILIYAIISIITMVSIMSDFENDGIDIATNMTRIFLTGIAWPIVLAAVIKEWGNEQH